MLITTKPVRPWECEARKETNYKKIVRQGRERGYVPTVDCCSCYHCSALHWRGGRPSYHVILTSHNITYNMKLISLIGNLLLGIVGAIVNDPQRTILLPGVKWGGIINSTTLNDPCSLERERRQQNLREKTCNKCNKCKI